MITTESVQIVIFSRKTCSAIVKKTQLAPFTIIVRLLHANIYPNYLYITTFFKRKEKFSEIGNLANRKFNNSQLISDMARNDGHH